MKMDENQLLLSIEELYKDNNYQECLKTIEENEDVITKKYYEIIPFKINCLIKLNKLIDALLIIKEELNVNAQVVKSLGFIKYTSHWNYKETEFDINNVAEIFYTKFVGYTNGTQVGLDGEFKPDVSVLEISKQEMIENVAEFTKFGIKLD